MNLDFCKGGGLSGPRPRFAVPPPAFFANSRTFGRMALANGLTVFAVAVVIVSITQKIKRLDLASPPPVRGTGSRCPKAGPGAAVRPGRRCARGPVPRGGPPSGGPVPQGGRGVASRARSGAREGSRAGARSEVGFFVVLAPRRPCQGPRNERFTSA